jgi:hypothetical protein
MRYLVSHCYLLEGTITTLDERETYPCKAIENVHVVTRVQIIDGTFTIDFESV